MQENGRQPAGRHVWSDHRARPEGTVDLRLSFRSMVVGPVLYLVGMLIFGILSANFLVSWLFGVVLFALLVSAWVSRDASRHQVPGGQLWGLAAGFVPFAGLTMYLMRRDAQGHGLS